MMKKYSSRLSLGPECSIDHTNLRNAPISFIIADSGLKIQVCKEWAIDIMKYSDVTLILNISEYQKERHHPSIQSPETLDMYRPLWSFFNNKEWPSSFKSTIKILFMIRKFRMSIFSEMSLDVLKLIVIEISKDFTHFKHLDTQQEI